MIFLVYVLKDICWLWFINICGYLMFVVVMRGMIKGFVFVLSGVNMLFFIFSGSFVFCVVFFIFFRKGVILIFLLMSNL